MNFNPINIEEKLNLFEDFWSPKIIAGMNDYHFKVVKIKGEFIWHKHDETDEAFFVIKGNMKIEFRDGTLNLKEGEMFVVPKGIEHKPVAENECSVLLIEPAGTVNTGDVEDKLTARELKEI